MFSDVELIFDVSELKFDDVEHKFSVDKHNFLLGVRTTEPKGEDNFNRKY